VESSISPPVDGAPVPSNPAFAAIRGISPAMPSLAVGIALLVEGVAAASALASSGGAWAAWVALPPLVVGAITTRAAVQGRSLSAGAMVAVAAEGLVFGLLALALVAI
jgi:hypothetical protein